MGSAVARVTGWRRSGAAVGKVNIKRPPIPKAAAKDLADKTLHQPEKQLLDRLKDVYVSSTDNVVPHENIYGTDRRPKPSQNTAGDEGRDIFTLTAAPSKGWLGMKEVSLIMQHHQLSKEEEWTAARVTEVYGVGQADAEALLKYFIGYKVIHTFQQDHPEMKLHHLHE